ncbi:MAG: Rnf electron transport complex subunit RnfA [Methanohalobium sp.]|uniref:Rnf electron transport complex subunit RnfA n=1 Tax=Methanohalobium sp. TaxID=2837493 RepID=UPI00397A32EA
MADETLFSVLMQGVFIENLILMQFLGLCPFIGVTKDTKSSAGMSLAVIFVVTIASVVTYLIYTFLLEPMGLQFLRIISFIVVIASLVQLVEFVLRKKSPAIYRSLGIYLPLIVTNCAILGSVLLNIRAGYDFTQSVTFGLAAGIGFTLVLLIMAGIRERSSLVHVHSSVKGVPHAFFFATLLSMAFVNYFEVIPLGG